MKNRDRLGRKALYDVLATMNSNLIAGRRKNTKPCIMSALHCEYVWERDERCARFGSDCGRCLQAWLNEDEGSDAE